jgi:hypothetical protein
MPGDDSLKKREKMKVSQSLDVFLRARTKSAPQERGHLSVLKLSSGFCELTWHVADKRNMQGEFCSSQSRTISSSLEAGRAAQVRAKVAEHRQLGQQRTGTAVAFGWTCQDGYSALKSASHSKKSENGIGGNASIGGESMMGQPAPREPRGSRSKLAWPRTQAKYWAALSDRRATVRLVEIPAAELLAISVKFSRRRQAEERQGIHPGQTTHPRNFPSTKMPRSAAFRYPIVPGRKEWRSRTVNRSRLDIPCGGPREASARSGLRFPPRPILPEFRQSPGEVLRSHRAGHIQSFRAKFASM